MDTTKSVFLTIFVEGYILGFLIGTFKLIRLYNQNSCKKCKYYYEKNNVCQLKKCATCGCHPYVNWFDRHFCEPFKAESEEV